MVCSDRGGEKFEAERVPYTLRREVRSRVAHPREARGNRAGRGAQRSHWLAPSQPCAHQPRSLTLKVTFEVIAQSLYFWICLAEGISTSSGLMSLNMPVCRNHFKVFGLQRSKLDPKA